MKTCLALVLVLFVCSAVFAEEFTVTRFAGTDGGHGYVDATGTAARFGSPVDVIADAGGNVYVVDGESHIIRKITPAGVVSTFAGLSGESGLVDGRGGVARFTYPYGVAIDLSGNIHVADYGNNAIRKISPSGIVTTVATGLGYVWDVAVDSAGNVYVTNVSEIRKYSAAGVHLATFAGTAGAWRLAVDSADNVFFTTDTAVKKLSTTGVVSSIPASFTFARGIAIDAAGDLYVNDQGPERIYRLTQSGTKTIIAGSGSQGDEDGIGTAASFLLSLGVATAPGNLLYVADQYNFAVRKIALSNSMVTTFAGKSARHASTDGDADTARFFQPRDGVFDSQGNLFVAHTSSVRKITPAGVVSTFAGSVTGSGSQDGTGTAARFDRPNGIAIDGADNLYVADYENHTIRKITPAAVVTTLAGSPGQSGSTDGTGSEARFLRPNDVIVHSNGDLYIADEGNHTIRRMTPAGVVTTFAGSAGMQGSTDAVGTAARFDVPTSITRDASGNLYVADYLNNVIRKITVPGADVTTFAGDPDAGGGIDGTGPTASFYAPGGITFDGVDLYVVDANRIFRRVTLAAVVTTLAGTGRTAMVDGTGYWARFVNPIGVAANGPGDVYVMDMDANNIRRARAPGISDIATQSSFNPPVNTVVQLDTNPSTATSWEWKVFRRPAGSVAELSATNIRNPTFTPDVADLYVLLLRAEGPAGVRFSRVEIGATGCDPLASVVASVPTPNVCSNGTGSTASVAVSGGGTLAYQWGWRATSGGAINPIGGATSASYVLNGADFGSAGTKYLVVTVTPSCGPPLVSNQLSITVTAPPSAVISASSGVFANGPHNFASVNDAGAGATYTWTVTNGSINSGQGTRSIEYTAGASGAVSLGIQVDLNGCSASGGATVPIIPRAPGAVMLYTVSPCRVFDTRVTGPALASNTTQTVAVAGVCGIPSSAKVAVINMTVVSPGGVGWLTVFPADGSLPPTSTLNYATGRTRANNAVVPLSSLGGLKVYNFNGAGSATHYIIDVMGWFE